LKWTVLLGVVCGAILLIRINGLLSVAAILLALLIAREWRALFISSAVTLIAFSPQFVYNVAYFGSPFTIGYQVVHEPPPDGLFSPTYLLNVLRGPYASIALFGIAAIALVVTAGLWALWKRDRIGTVAVGVWGVGYLVFFACYYFSWQGALTRFLIPGYPPLALIATSALLGYLPERQAHFAAPVDSPSPQIAEE